MCGIAGFAGLNHPSDAPKLLRRMTSAIQHRGPDDAGYYISDLAFLGHRRLSIIDVSGGHQPMANETGSVWIVYNGEIFNHADVRPELERKGHVYTNRSDTETILHSYEEYGADCVTKFRGMFAFAIWDEGRKRLFCARDRLGIKPFYYYWDGRDFVFASEIKALLEHPAVPVELNQEALPEYLAFGYVSGENTLFNKVRKLTPGHVLELDLAGGQARMSIRQYWDLLTLPADPARGDEQDWVAETRRRLEETVRMRLMSDVPLGTFLSGGVDSSAITAIMKRLRDEPVKTFSVGYAEQQYSELSYAARVAQTLGTEHHEVRIGMDDFFGALPGLIWHEDEPISWPSSVSLFFVSRLAATEVKVVLTGEGSDELFGGYERYGWNMWNSRWAERFGVVPEGLRRTLRSWIASTGLLRADLRRKLGHTFIGREATVESLFLDNFYCAFSRDQQQSLLPSSVESIYQNYLCHWNACEGASFLRRMLYADQKTYLVELLMKQDQMSMAYSIESRVPFLDHTFVEFAMRVPDSLKIRGGVQKYVLKKAVEDLLPHDIVHRKKMGFPTPLRQWLLDPAAAPFYDALTDRSGFTSSLLDPRQLGDLLSRHRQGAEDATDRIWRLLNLQIWADLFLTGRRDRWMEGWDALRAPVLAQE